MKTMGSGPLGILAVCVTTIIFGACKDDNKQDIPIDGGVVVDLAKVADSMSSHDIGRPDMETTPKISIAINSPRHFSTGHETTFQPSITIQRHFYDKDDALALATKQLKVLAVPELTEVEGTWTPVLDSKTNAHFVPTKPLTGDKEYILQATSTALIEAPREKTVFRVGSLPRIVQISFGSLDSNQIHDGLSIMLSENVPTASLVAALKVSADGKALSLTSRSTGEMTYNLGLKLAGGFDINKEHTIEIQPDVGAPKMLDSEYKGKESSKAFTVTLKPVDHLTNTPWMPQVSY